MNNFFENHRIEIGEKLPTLTANRISLKQTNFQFFATITAPMLNALRQR